LRIVELTAFHVRIPLRRRIRHASHTRTSTDNIVVQCALEDGTVGFGEGVPRDYVTGETIDGAIQLLKSSSHNLRLDACQDFGQAVAMAEGFSLTPVPGDTRGCQGNAARCALELSVLDAFGQHFGQPLSQVTRIIAPELYEQQPKARYSGAITSADGIKLRVAAWRLRLYGFRQIKVKVGIDGQDDARRLQVVRQRVGPRKDLRVDANEAWEPASVSDRIRELEPFGISAVEQPVSHENVNCLTEARRQTSVPIMLDESLCSRFDAEEAIARGTCDLFNLRLSKCGGFIPTLRLAQLARQNGLGCQLGCQVGETALLSAAGRHFACSVSGLRYLEGSYDRHLMTESLGTQDLTFRRGGWAPALDGAGLGVGLATGGLEKVTIRKESLLG
jgi:muconate cycloisomerase